MLELRLLDPNGYTAISDGAVTRVPDDQADTAAHRLLTVVAPADAQLPTSVGYRPQQYRVQRTPIDRATPPTPLSA